MPLSSLEACNTTAPDPSPNNTPVARPSGVLSMIVDIMSDPTSSILLYFPDFIY